MSSGIFAAARPYDGAKGGDRHEDNRGVRAAGGAGLRAFAGDGAAVDTGGRRACAAGRDGCSCRTKRRGAVSGAADAPDAAEALDNRTVRLLAGEEILELSMEDYLTGVLLSEMPVDFSPEARKAQVVAARTFTCRKLRKPKAYAAQTCARTSPAVRRGQAGGIWNGNTAMILTAVWQSSAGACAGECGGGSDIWRRAHRRGLFFLLRRRDGSGGRGMGNGRAVFAVGRESRRRNRAPVFFARDFRTRGIFRDSAR